MGTPIGKTTDGSVLSAQTHGETHKQNDTSLAGRPKDTNPYPGRDPYRGGGASRRLHKGGRPPSAAAPLCGFLYMGLSLGTGSCLWDARPAMCRFAYGFLPGSEHRALQPCVAFPIIGNRFQLLQIKSNNVPPVLFHRFPVSSRVAITFLSCEGPNDTRIESFFEHIRESAAGEAGMCALCPFQG